MAAHVHHLIQDENLNVHHKGKDANASKAKKGTGLGGSKPLTNITNSGKPSPQKMTLKKNFLKNVNDFEDQCQHNYNNSQTRALIQNENLTAGCEVAGKPVIPKSQKRAGVGGRKALSNITNSKKSSPLNPTRKNHPKKLIDIEQEQCLHNHQECINAQTRGVDVHLLLRTIGFEEDLAATPMLPASLSQAKGDNASPPSRFLELEEIPEMQNGNHSTPPRCCWTKNLFHYSPSPNRFFSSPKLALRLLDLQ